MFSLLSKLEIERIHHATMEVLEKTGVLVENIEILDLLEKAGARVDKKKMIAQIPEYVVMEWIKKIPSSFVLHKRDGSRIRIGGDKTVISSGAGPTWILDLDTGEPRPVRKDDVVQVSRLTDALEHLELCMSPIIQDVTPALVDVHSAEAMFCNTTKPPWVCPGDGFQARYIIRMAAIVAGDMQNLQDKPLLLGIASPNSPLRLAPKDIEVVKEFTVNKLPIALINCPNIGATTPISIAGTLVVTCAELLAMGLVAELLNPGNPVALGPSPVATDMRTANPCFAAPECALVATGIAEIMRHYRIPSFASMATSDSMVIDAQTGYETVWGVQLPMMASVNLLVGVGHIGSGNIESYEKLVIDNEIFGALRRILKGVAVTDRTLAVDVIHAVGPKGHFLAQRHTRELIAEERWFPKISNRKPLFEWKKEKSDLWLKARKEVKEILHTHQPEPLESTKLFKIRDLVEEAEKAVAR